MLVAYVYVEHIVFCYAWGPITGESRSRLEGGAAMLLLLCKWDVSADVGGKSPMSCIREKIDPSVSWKEVARKNNRCKNISFFSPGVVTGYFVGAPGALSGIQSMCSYS